MPPTKALLQLPPKRRREDDDDAFLFATNMLLTFHYLVLLNSSRAHSATRAGYDAARARPPIGRHDNR